MNASIVIPVFNGEKTIPKTLEALQKQTGKMDFEIIVIDDGSTDRTADVIRKFPGARLVSQQNAGPAMARNRGAKLAKNEIVVFLDADCVPEKDWLPEMLKPFSDSKVVGVQGRYVNPIRNLMAEFVQLEIEERYERMARFDSIDFIGSYSAAYRKKVFLEEGGFDENYRIASGEDPDFSFKLADKGYKMVFNPKAIAAHFHPTSIKKYWKTKFFRAYWRVRMYRKFPHKLRGDSYTNPWLKFQAGFFIAAFGIAIAMLLSGLWALDGTILVWPGVTFLGLAVVFTWPTVFFLLSRNWKAGFAAFLILPVNAFLFATGLIAGAIASIGGKPQ